MPKAHNLDDPRTPKDSFTEIALNLIDVSDGIDTNPHLIATLEQINSPKEDEIAAFSELYEDVYVGSPSPVPIAQAESSETTDINRASKLIEQYAIQPVSEKAQHSLDKYDVKELTSTASMTDLFVTAVNKAVPLASAAGDVLEYALPEVALKKAFSDIAVALNQLNDSDMDSQTIVILREIGKLDLQSKALEQHLLSALARLENTSVPQTLMQALQHVMIALTLPFSLNKLRHLVGLVDPRVPQEMNQSFGEIALALIAESDKIAQNPNALLALSHFTNSEDNDIEALLELYQDAPALVQDKLGDCSKKVLDAVLNSTTQDVPEQPSQSAEHPVSTVAIIEEQGQQPQQPAIGTDSDIEKPPKKEEDIGELLKKADLNSLNAVVTRRFMHILKDIDSQSFENIQRRITKERVAFEKAIEKVREYKISSRNRIAFKGCLALFDSSIVALKSLEMIKPDDIKSYHVAKEHDDKARNKALQERRGFVSGVHAKALEKVARSHNPKEADIDSTKAAANFLDNFDRLDKNTRLFFGKASKFLTKTKAQANQLEPQTKNFAQDVLVKTSPKSNPRSRKSSDEDIIKLSSADVAKLSPADVEENIARFTINQVRSLTIKQVSELNAITIINLSTDKIDALYEIAPLTQIQNSEIVNKALKDMKKKQIDAIFPKFFKGFHVDIWQDNIRSNTYEVLHLYLELSKIKKEIYQQNSGFFGNLFIRGPLYYLENINFRLNRLIDKGSTEVDDLKPVASGIGQFAKGFVNFIFWHLQLPFFLLMRIQQISQNPDMMYLPKIAWQEIKNISMSLRYLYKFLLVVTLFVPTAFLSLLLKGVSLVIPDFLKSSVEVVETPAGDEKQKRRYLNDLVNALEKQQPNKNIDPESLKKIKSFKDSYRMENFNLEVLKEDVIEIIGFDPEEVIQQYYASKATQPTTKSETVTPPDSKQFFAVTQRQALPTVTPSKESPPTIINEGEVETNKRKLGG